MRTFEIILNGEFHRVAYTLEMENAKKARNYAVKEAKYNNNESVDIIEVDGMEYVSGTIKIK